MRLLSIICWIILGLIIIVFAVLNSYTVMLHYYFNTVNIYFPLLLVITAAIGVILGIFIMLPTLLKTQNTSRKLKQLVRQLEQQKNVGV